MPAFVRTATDLDLGIESNRVIGLMGSQNGKYPSGNSVLVSGTDGTVLIDPSLSVYERNDLDPSLGHRIDHMLVSHAHEDHLAGCAKFPDASVHAHAHDLLGLQSIDGILEVYGFGEPTASTWATTLRKDFHYCARPDAQAFSDGHRFDLGTISVTVVHLPGHTRGHCGFFIEPDDVFFVADVDLTSFGPYYGDHWSDLEDFERAIDRVASIAARHYVTFHHKGVVSDRSEFLRQLSAFRSVISDRESRMLQFLSEPRTLADMVTHRFIYRPGVELAFGDHVEARSISLHLARLQRDGAVFEVEPGAYRATTRA